MNASPQPTIFLIDGSAYIHRAYHALQGLATSNGIPTNAVFGFVKMLLKLREEQQPEFAAMVFDAKGPTFRHETYPQYKANRPPMPDDLIIQIPYIKQLTEGFCIPILEMSGYEADDLIGTIARQAKDTGFSVVIVSGDKDFLQLISDQTILWDPMKDKTTDLAAVRNEFGVEPHQMIDVMGLSGDASDNIPGVPGIGIKTALDLIRAFGSIESLYERIEDITKKKQKENLIQYREQAMLSRTLATICTDAPVVWDAEAFRLKSPDIAVLSQLFKLLEFRQLQKQFPSRSDLSRKRYDIITDQTQLAKLIADLKTSEIIAVDTETTSENSMKAELVGFSFSTKPDEAVYIPCGHVRSSENGVQSLFPEPVPGQLRLQDVLNALKPVIENPAVKKVGQNIKYDWTVFRRYGIELAGVIFDTMIGSYLINPSKRAHNLDQIALDFLNHQKIPFEEVVGKSKNFSEAAIDRAAAYACEDADITLAAYRILSEKLREAGLSYLMETVEMPLIPVLMDMEMNGICVDRERLKQLSKTFEQQMRELEQQIYTLAGEEFNIGSPNQLRYILFDKLNLPTQKKTKKKTGYSTDADVLVELAAVHELPAVILKHRTVAKLKSTYTDALLKLADPKTGRVHTSFNQTVTATGRLSSSDPNLQNIPIRDEEGRAIRSAFIPQKGWLLLSADYSQIELRILAHYSDDPILIKAFNEDEDIHTRTALELFGGISELITPELRRQAKAINFGIIYGMSPFGLAQELGITLKMAKTYIEQYFKRYQGVKQWIDKTVEVARQTLQSATLLGRIRLLPDIKSSNRNVRQSAERTAINTPIQGTAADFIKLAMIQVDAELKRQKLRSAMLLSVHDELVFEVPPEERDTMAQLVKSIMENVWSGLKVPLKVHVGFGNNWAEAH